MAFRCGQNYTDSKNMLKTIRKSKLVKYIECNKKYESRFANLRFLGQQSAAMLEQCCNHSKQCRNNVTTLCCAKSRCCESSCVTSP